MDISGTVQCVLDEFEACDNEATSIAFQNHLYGCFSVIEQHTENGSVLLDLSDNDASGSNSWSTLGIDYGFLEDTRAVYTGSDRYRTVMTPYLTQILSQEIIDELESLVFEGLNKADAKYFITALEMPDLSGDLMAEINAALNIPVHKIQEAIVDLPPKSKTKTKFNNTRGHKSKTIGKTRRRKQSRGV
jgi:hypothetical protein